MYYLTIAMHTVNLSQAPYSSYSHPNGAMDLKGVDSGVDFFYCSTGYIKCIGKWAPGYNTYFFQPCDNVGRPVKVMCADGVARVVTIAMTHSNRKYVKTQIGRIYKQGEPIYEEGHLGGKNMTGNHIHIEVAEGTKTSKYYDGKLKCYRMYGELNPAKTFFIDTSFSKIGDIKGIEFKTVSEPEVKEVSTKSEEKIAYGCHTYIRNGIKAVTYRASSKAGYTLHLISAGGPKKLKRIDLFDSNKIVKVAVLNCNYFNMQRGADYGLHYGVEMDSLIDGFSQTASTAGLLAYYIDKAGNSHLCTTASFLLQQDAVQVALTPYAVTMLNGQDVNYRSTNLASKANKKGTQSAICKLENGDYVLAAFTDCYPKDVREFFKSFDEKVEDVCVLDSGGSTQMRAWSGKKMETVVKGDGRQLPNVVCLAKKV